MSFYFAAIAKPFPRWWGPYSPARGKTRGFRINGGRLGVWVTSEDGRSFWNGRACAGLGALEKLVQDNFGGGRVLLLPDGGVVKPLQRDVERGKRVYLGEFSGDVILEKPDGGTFSLENPGRLKPGDRWPGPSCTGLECRAKPNGALECTWYHPTSYGRDSETYVMCKASPAIARGFRAARPDRESGRVRVTARGHVITNRKVRGAWLSFYVGRVDVDRWPHLDGWIE